MQAAKEVEELRSLADKLRIQKEVEISRTKDTVRDEQHHLHLRELETRDELNGMLREKVNVVQGWVDSLEKELLAKDLQIAVLERSHTPSRLPTDNFLGLGLKDGTDPSDATAERIESHRTGLRHRLHSTELLIDG